MPFQEEAKQDLNAPVILRRYIRCIEKDFAVREDFVQFANRHQPFPMQYAYRITYPATQGGDDRCLYRSFTLKKKEPTLQNPLSCAVIRPKKGKNKFKQLKRNFTTQAIPIYCAADELNYIYLMHQKLKSNEEKEINSAISDIENKYFPVIIARSRLSSTISKSATVRRNNNPCKVLTEICEEDNRSFCTI
jgi:hypothetical protein